MVTDGVGVLNQCNHERGNCQNMKKENQEFSGKRRTGKCNRENYGEQHQKYVDNVSMVDNLVIKPD